MGKFQTKVGDSVISGDFTKLEKLIEGLEKKYFVDIGILGAGGGTKGGLSIAGIGAVHEFGTDRAGRGKKTVIPARSFIRMPLETGQEFIENEVSPHIEKNVGTGNIKEIFNLIGIAGVLRIQEAFETGGFGEWAPNSDVTIFGSKPNKKGEKFIKGKKSSQPLIDDGTLRKSITSKVGGGE